ncbi:homoserine kinase [Enterococcus saccharolyticus]|uniref:Homoserine kinase n=1 Tax=Candidatus Enterococcus willemsii TaxID=1857215 RepID=A0ABQ6Z1X4_9ENTE|nr:MULTISPECIES: homoserine kinase [Enterococcus]KAF1305536.1 homoserine kinase [Enterococcus sp. CU12B]MCD5002706.1 homoserine kinase [Enterococcus saccharolyticus]
MKIRVPATSANLGPGFDSCGIALSMYLCVEVLEDSDSWEIQHTLGAEIPTDETNLLLQIALKLAPTLTPKKLKMTSDIPLARGLGSSSSVIVAGIELANRLGNLNLSEKRKVEIATQIEGHPDNVAPAITGDFVVACHFNERKEDSVPYVKHYFPECDIIAFIPNTELLTSESRSVLPDSFSYKEAVEASAIANVMIAAVLNSNLPLAGQMMQEDRWHERYRGKLVPHLADIRQICREEGAYGCYLSGAGPTILILTPEDKTEKTMKLLHALDSRAQIEQLSIDREGIQVF